MAGRNGNKTNGKNFAKCGKYKASGRREQQKVRNIRRSSGHDAALKYATDKGIASYMAVLEQEREDMMTRLGRTHK